MQRSLLIFENSIKAERSRIMYRFYLDKFIEFTKIKDYDALVSLDTDTLQMLLENYVIHLKGRRLKAKSIKNYLNGIELFLDVNKKTYYKKVIHKMFPEDTKEGGENPYTTKDIQGMLKVCKAKREIALIHFLASTGARPAVVSDPVLRLRHLYPMPEGCKAVLLYENSRQEYWAFLTPESVMALDDYFNERRKMGEYLTSDSPIFANHLRVRGQKVKSLNSNRIGLMIGKLVKRAEIERVKSGNRFDKAVNVAFRKRFNGILKMNNNVNSNIAEKLMAHKKGLDGVYLKPTREQCFAEFRKAISELIIDDNERLKIKTEQQQTKISELEESQARELLEVKSKLLSLSGLVEKLLNEKQN